MKNLLLGGILAASMFAQVADAGKPSVTGPMMISGNGCAFTKGPATRKITLSGSSHENHKKIMAGETIKREQTFKYDFSKLVNCGLKHVNVTLKSEDKHIDGLEFISAKLGNGGNVFDLSAGPSGQVKMTVKYKVKDPAKYWMLTREFSYKHVFEMHVEAKW